jgi:branched-chain amino acid transport system permease protein
VSVQAGARVESPSRVSPRPRPPIPLLAGLAIAVMFPLIDRDPYIIGVLILIGIYAIVAESWNLVMGVAGIWSFAQLAIFAVGAYTNAILLVKLHVPSLMAFAAGGLAALAAGLLVGIPAIRLRGIYVVLFTLAFQECMRILISSDDSGLTGATFGLYGFDAFGLMRLSAVQTALVYYYAGLALLVVCSLVVYRTMHSPIGLAFRALRDSEAYAIARGISRVRYQVIVFAISSLLTGLAGALYADYFDAVSPTILGFDQIGLLLAIIVVGGWGSFWGPIVGALVVVGVSEKLHDIEDWRLLIFGAWLVATIVYLPRGLVSLGDAFRGSMDVVKGRINHWLEG